MQVSDVMTSKPACCEPNTGLREVARMMEENDCGCIPVVSHEHSTELRGVVTDRDIVMRTIAQGRNPLEMTAEQVMSGPVVTAKPEESVEDCCVRMEEKQVRRIPVVDASGDCCGIVAQADIARRSGEDAAGEVVREVSRPSGRPSQVGHQL
jgi:CBS domain-containing protein